jgi:hypothetical protein
LHLTFRVGAFDAPIVPNNTQLDPTFRQFQLVGEIERRYDLWQQPGKVAITGFLTRARMGSFDAAIQLAELTGGPADITAVRTYTTKAGIAGNMEQQITSEIGVFARAGWSPGKLEPDAFTDDDATVAGGVSLSGKLWGRPDDNVGLAGILNTISSSHQACFNAGGLTALLGDGMLPHPGHEGIVEAYYGFPVYSWRAHRKERGLALVNNDSGCGPQSGHDIFRVASNYRWPAPSVGSPAARSLVALLASANSVFCFGPNSRSKRNVLPMPLRRHVG